MIILKEASVWECVPWRCFFFYEFFMKESGLQILIVNSYVFLRIMSFGA